MDRCLYCGAESPKHRCAGCWQAPFCSPACLEAAWPAHKAECKRARRQQRARQKDAEATIDSLRTDVTEWRAVARSSEQRLQALVTSIDEDRRRFDHRLDVMQIEFETVLAELQGEMDDRSLRASEERARAKAELARVRGSCKRIIQVSDQRMRSAAAERDEAFTVLGRCGRQCDALQKELRKWKAFVGQGGLRLGEASGTGSPNVPLTRFRPLDDRQWQREGDFGTRRPIFVAVWRTLCAYVGEPDPEMAQAFEHDMYRRALSKKEYLNKGTVSLRVLFAMREWTRVVAT